MESNIPFEREKVLKYNYKNKMLKHSYKADFVYFGKIIVELKALPSLTKIEEAQVINYLKITVNKLGLLVNFGKESLETVRNFF